MYALGATNVSVRDLDKLPSDPAALRTALLGYFDGGGGGLPGVRSLGAVPDQRGRQGQGFAFTTASPATGTIEHRFVIDPATGRALGQETHVLTPAGTIFLPRPNRV